MAWGQVKVIGDQMSEEEGFISSRFLFLSLSLVPPLASVGLLREAMTRELRPSKAESARLLHVCCGSRVAPF